MRTLIFGTEDSVKIGLASSYCVVNWWDIFDGPMYFLENPY